MAVSVIVASTVPDTLAVTLAVCVPFRRALPRGDGQRVADALASRHQRESRRAGEPLRQRVRRRECPRRQDNGLWCGPVFVTCNEHDICDRRAAVQLIVVRPLHVSVAEMVGAVLHVPDFAETVPVPDACHPGAADAAVALSARAAGVAASANAARSLRFMVPPGLRWCGVPALTRPPASGSGGQSPESGQDQLVPDESVTVTGIENAWLWHAGAALPAMVAVSV